LRRAGARDSGPSNIEATMRVLVCEPNVLRPYLEYAALTALAARAVTSDVTLCVSREARDTVSFDRFVRPLDGRVTVRADIEAPRRRSESYLPSRLCNRFAHWAFLQRHLRAVRPNYAILPSGDRVANMLAFLPKAVAAGADIEIVLHTSVIGQPGALSFEGRLRAQLIPRAPAVARFHFTDWTQYMEARRRYPSVSRKFRLAPNPVPIADLLSREDARRALGLPVQGRMAAVASPKTLQEIRPLLDLYTSEQLPDDWRLLIVGPMHPGVVDYIETELCEQRRDSRVILLENTTEDAAVFRAVSAADLVVGRLTPVPGVSTTCLKATVAGRRFLTASTPWSDMMASLGLGESFNDISRDAFLGKFRRAVEQSRTPIDAELVKRVRRFHSAEHFMEAISDRLRARMGLRSGASGLTWDWVRDAAAARARSSSVA
jgi:hypothetical protein